jgi:hypothetical protein
MKTKTKATLVAIVLFIIALYAFVASQTQAWLTFFAETPDELKRLVFYSNFWVVASAICFVAFIVQCIYIFRLKHRNKRLAAAEQVTAADSARGSSGAPVAKS